MKNNNTDEMLNNGQEPIENEQKNPPKGEKKSNTGKEEVSDKAVNNTETAVSEEKKEDTKDTEDKKDKKGRSKKLFGKKQSKKEKEEKLKNKNLAKKSTYVVIFTVILIGVLVLVNVLSTILAQRLPTTIDTTKDSSNSLTDSNITFIKGIKEKVDIIVCASRDAYTGTDMINYAYNNYYVQETATPYNYFNQTVTLLEAYPKYNSNINVSYVDTQSPDFKALESDSSVSISFGDILVRCKRNVGGKQETFSKIITFKDIYDLYDASNGYAAYGMGYYTITSSNIESEVSSAIYTVASSEKRKIALLSGHSKSGDADNLLGKVEDYNFEVTKIEGTVSKLSLDSVDMVLVVSPTSDLSGDELKVLDEYLDNGGKRGKSFLVFGSVASPETPNLNQFMEEWGIVVENGMSYETNSWYRDTTATTIMLFNKKDDMTKGLNSSEKYYYADSNVALSRGFETDGSRTSHVLMSTSDTAVIAPKNIKGGYTPSSSDKKAERPVIIVTEDTTTDEQNENKSLSSYVGYFASSNFISDSWSQYDAIGNMEYTLSVVNTVSGRDGSDMYFIPKITGVTSMTLNETQKGIVKAVVLYIVPIAVLVGGIFIWIWRRNR